MLSIFRSAIVALGLIVASNGSGQVLPATGTTDRNASSDSWRQIEQLQHSPIALRHLTDAEKRELANLESQWMAAKAAKRQANLARWQTFIAGFATVFAGVGTWFLIRTFRETRQAAMAAALSAHQAEQSNRQTRDFFFASQRPWVRISHEGPSKASLLQNKLALTLPITIENIGRSPAIDVSIIAININIRFPAQNIEDIIKPMAEESHLGAKSIFTETTLLPGTKERVIRHLDFDIRDFGPVGSTGDPIVDYVIRVRFSYQAAERQYGAVISYTTEFSGIPTLAMTVENISPHHWRTSRISGGAVFS